MKIAVLGGGIIGVTTAWFLVRDGHEVTVIDRQDTPAAETSFANAGFISPGRALSWAAPGAPQLWLRSMFRKDAPIKLRLRADPALWRWCFGFLGNCTDARWRANSLPGTPPRRRSSCAPSIWAGAGPRSGSAPPSGATGD